MSCKLVFFIVLVVIIFTTASAGLLKTILVPSILQDKFQLAPTKEGYRLNIEGPNGSKREEVGMVVNPGTPNEQLVVMGTYSVYDDKKDYETITMYTADKAGYNTHYKLKNRTLNPSTLKSLT